MIFDIFVSHDDVMEIEYFTYVLHEFSLSLKLVGMTADICTVKNKFKPKKQVKKLVVILSSRATWKKQAWKNKPKISTDRTGLKIN